MLTGCCGLLLRRGVWVECVHGDAVLCSVGLDDVVELCLWVVGVRRCETVVGRGRHQEDHDYLESVFARISCADCVLDVGCRESEVEEKGRETN